MFKKIIFVIFFSFLLYFNANASNPEIILSNNVPLYGSGIYAFWSNNIHVEKIVFPKTGSGVWVNAQHIATGSGKVNGYFWIQSLSDISDTTLWWVTFDHGVSGSETILVQSGSSNQYIFRWFAWSKAAGWIYFWDELGLDKAIYNRTTGTVTGYGWSQNIGWIPMSGLTLVTTAPSINLPSVFAADGNKSITITSPVDIETTIDNHNNLAQTTYTTKNLSHNFQTVKPWNYDYSVEDEFWNKISWNFQVVAAIPSLVTPTISSGDKIADWTLTEKHSIEMELKDQYGNPVISVPWIKEVEVEIGFHNDVDQDQILNYWLWNAISYTSSDFLWLSWAWWNTATGSNTSWDYLVSFTSLAPTNAWYSYAAWNININKLNYKVDALWSHVWVWEVWKVDKFWWTMLESSNFAFIPAVKVDSITAIPEYIMRDIEVTFSGEIKKYSSDTITDFKVQHILDIGSNLLLSFQNIDVVWWSETKVCTGNNMTSWYIPNDINSNCYLSSNLSSNIFLSKWNLTDNYTSSFQATPKIVNVATDTFSTDYSSIVSYTINSNDIKYYSLKHTFGETINQQVKIAWIANSGFETSPDSTNKILDTTISKADLRMQIAKNVETLIKNGVSNIPSNIIYSGGTITVSNLPSWKDTIIVKWWDLIITGNITKSVLDKLNAIVVLRENGVGGNVWIKKDVQFISAIIFADGHLFSGNGSEYYSDTPMIAKDQFFIKGSVVSNNTIGWASDPAGLKCPYRFNSSTPCDEKEAKRYDLNHFRYYIDGSVGSAFEPGTWAWEIDTWPDVIDMTKTGYKAPMIVEYDNQIQLNPPKIFLNN